MAERDVWGSEIPQEHFDFGRFLACEVMNCLPYSEKVDAIFRFLWDCKSDFVRYVSPADVARRQWIIARNDDSRIGYKSQIPPQYLEAAYTFLSLLFCRGDGKLWAQFIADFINVLYDRSCGLRYWNGQLVGTENADPVYRLKEMSPFQGDAILLAKIDPYNQADLAKLNGYDPNHEATHCLVVLPVSLPIGYPTMPPALTYFVRFDSI